MITIINLSSQLTINSILSPLISTNLLYATIFIAPNFLTSPYVPKAQITYGCILAILTIIFTYVFPIVSPILLSLLITIQLVPFLNNLYQKINYIPKCQKAINAIIIIIAILTSLTINYFQ